MTTHRVGTYNVEPGHRPVERHAAMIEDRFDAERLDVLALQEASDYVRELARTTKHRLLWVPGAENVKCHALLVKKDARVEGIRSIDTPATYYATNGARRRSSCPLVAHVDGVMYVVIHAPVGAWTAGRHGRHFYGPLRRRLAYRAYVRRLLHVFAAHPDVHIVVLGDWNAAPDTRGLWSPDWLRRKGKAAFIRPHESTGHGEIDFAIVRRVTGFLNVRHTSPEPSDHRLVAGQMHA